MKSRAHLLIALLGVITVSCQSKESAPMPNEEEYRNLLLRECTQRIELSSVQVDLNRRVTLEVQTYRDRLTAASQVQEHELQKKLLWGKIEERNQALYFETTKENLASNKAKVEEFERKLRNKLHSEMQLAPLGDALSATQASLERFDLSDPLLKAIWQEEHSARSEASVAEMKASLRKSAY